MTDQDRNHWVLDIIINVCIVIIAAILLVNWVNEKFDEMNPKLDTIIEQQTIIIDKLNE